MATKLTPKKSGGEKPAAKKAPAKKPAANGPATSPGAKPTTGARKTPRSHKGTTLNAETAQVLRDADAGKNLLDYPSLEAMFEDLDI